jgi:uncharacterized membrane protein
MSLADLNLDTGYGRRLRKRRKALKGRLDKREEIARYESYVYNVLQGRKEKKYLKLHFAIDNVLLIVYKYHTVKL